MTDKYKLMIYFAHSTMVMYSKDILSDEDMTLGEFAEVNKDVIKRVRDEAISIFNYELSHRQIGKLCGVYMSAYHNPMSVKETESYVPEKDHANEQH